MAKLLFVVCAAHSGYRRGGVRFTKGENTVDAEKLSAEQLQQINNDSLLIVGEYADGLSLASLDEPTAKNLLPEANQGGNSQGPLGSRALSDGVKLTLEQAFAQLQPDNKEHFTGTGLPQLDALERLVGHKVTSAERAEAWEAYQAKLAAVTEGAE